MHTENKRLTMSPKSKKQLKTLLSKSNFKDESFSSEFNSIISEEIEGYDGDDGDTKERLMLFFKDVQRSGCSSGLVGAFIYNSDCKDFYIRHIDDLEEMKENMEEELGMSISNKPGLPHYTFICWLCFEEYCNDLYRTIFES